VTLDQLTPWLFGRTAGGIRWGLERTEGLLAGVGDPHRHFHSILIAGTNGKGSVAAHCDAALRAGSRGRIGLYTSPHLVSFAERVRIDGAPVDDATLLDAATRLRPAIEASAATFFEATTAMAFLVFAEAEVDLAVVEVGLGGRLDSTNVLRPLVTGVTNVGLDHMDHLGPDLASIATEKGGIFKEAVPALIGAEDAVAREVLERRAREAGAPFHHLDARARISDVRTTREGTTLALDSACWGRRELETRLIGPHQARNAAFAAEMLGLLPESLRPSWEEVARGCAGVCWPGRLQVDTVRGTTWVLDVAHNPAGAEALATALLPLDLPRPLVLLFAALADKDWRSMLRTLAPSADAILLTRPDSAPASRTWDPGDADAFLRHEGHSARVIPRIEDALSRATTLAPHGTVLVTGSVHTVGDALQYLQLPN
jgi:dihydrofolate synthase / folylpolyglutamate synthase